MMSQEQAKAWLPLIQAVADGKTLQTKVFRWVGDQLVADWVDVFGDVDFSTAPSRWRIKPEPKREWVRVALLKSGPGHRAFAYNEWSEVNIETDIFFGGWLTERIEYELPELNDSLAFSTNMPQSKIGVDK